MSQRLDEPLSDVPLAIFAMYPHERPLRVAAHAIETPVVLASVITLLVRVTKI